MFRNNCNKRVGMIALVVMVALMFLISSVPVTTIATNEGTRQEDDSLILKVAMQAFESLCKGNRRTAKQRRIVAKAAFKDV